MKMTRSILAMVEALAAMFAKAGDSAPFMLDTREERAVELSIVLPYDAAWIGGNSGATVVIDDNGVEIARKTGAGEFEYALTGPCKHVLTYKTLIDGEEQEEVYAATLFKDWKYEVDDDGGAVILGTSISSGVLVIPSEIDGYEVTGIGDNAFKSCSGLTSVTIPDSVASVGSKAFEGCDSLAEMSLPETISYDVPVSLDKIRPRGDFFISKGILLRYHGAGGDVVIPSGVTAIGAGVFQNCYALDSVIIPVGVTSIGSSAFSNCTGLTDLSIPGSVTSIEWNAFLSCSNIKKLAIPQMLCNWRFQERYFVDCWDKITDLEIQEGVTQIEEWAFESCAFENVVLPSTLQVIEEGAFGSCASLTNIVIPASVWSIGKSVFEYSASLAAFVVDEDNEYYKAVDGILFSKDGTELLWCPAGKDLTSYEIPADVTDIWDGAFSYCYGLTNITVAEGNTHYKSNDGILFSTDGTQLVQYPAGRVGAYSIPEGVEELSEGAFAGCRGLTAIDFPRSLESIACLAFDECTGLSSVVIPDWITEIGDSSFEWCTGLEEVRIPAGVTYIGDDADAFANCGAIRKVSVPQYVVSCGLEKVFSESFDKITRIVFEDDVTEIPNEMCEGMESLEEVVIGANVARIGQYAFSECVNLKSIAIPGNVKAIGKGAFEYCVNLEQVEIGEGLERIERDAFSCCYALGYINIPSSLNYIVNAFGANGKLQSFDIADGETYVGIDGVLYTKDNKTMVAYPLGRTGVFVLPEDVGLGDNVFIGNGLSSITLSSSIASFGGSIEFSFATNLVSINVPFDNTAYRSVDGVLFNKSMTQLICYPAGKTDKSYRVPDTVTSLAAGAFAGNPFLERIFLPSGITYIPAECFCDCANLEVLYYGGNVPGRASDAFEGVPETFRECGGSNVSSRWLASNIIEIKNVVNDEETPWTIDESVIHDGKTCLRSGAIGNDQTTSFKVSVEGPCKVSFNWKASSEILDGLVFDYAYFSLDDDAQGWLNDNGTLSGTAIAGQMVDWEEVELYLGEGMHPLCWTYCKDSLDDEDDSLIGEDCVWIDALEVHRKSRIAFNADGATGEVLSTVEGWPGEKIMLPSGLGFEWDDHMFNGWSDGFGVYEGGTEYTIPDGDRILCAQWIKKALVNFDINGGTGDAPISQKAWPNDMITLPGGTGFEMADHAFMGWSDGDEEYAAGDDYEVPAMGNTLRAVWKLKTFVSFDLNGGEGACPETIKELGGKVVALPDDTGISREDYVFDGWIVDEGEYSGGADYLVGETNVVLTAQWIAKRFLAFDIGGGEGATPLTIKDVPGTTITLPLAKGFKKPKYSFVGWSDGTTVYEPGVEYVISDSGVDFTAIWEANLQSAPVISSDDVVDGGEIDEKGFATIQILADDGASVYYTLDGSEPTTNSFLYVAQFESRAMSVTIKAIAVKDDYFDSEKSEFTFTRKPYSAAECLNVPDFMVETGENSKWVRVLGESAHDGVAMLQSGAIGEDESSYVEMTVEGEGKVSFWWKVSSYARRTYRDEALLFIDGVMMNSIAGEVDWTNEVYEVCGKTNHTVKWVYQKNNDGHTNGEDCAWLDEVVWTPRPTIPAIAVDAAVEEVEAAVDAVGFADEEVKEAIGGSAEEYVAFKTWAEGVEGGAEAVVDSEHAAASYLLGAAALMENEPTVEFSDVEIGGDSGEESEKGTITLSVTVKDGENAVAVASEKVANMFEATSDLGDWAGEAKLTPTIEVLEGEGNTMRFKVKPGDGKSPSAFLRIRK